MGWRQDIGDGLVMRAATPADTDRLVKFNSEMHTEPGRPGPSRFIEVWTRDLMTRPHPGLTLDRIVVVEEPASGRIVSSTLYFDHRWSYSGIVLPAGRPELVSTHPDFRRRGLIRQQFELMHRWGDQNGHLIQGITGIPYYYRQFGYDLALEEPIQRSASLASLPQRKPEETPGVTLREASKKDIPFIAATYDSGRSRSLFSARVSREELTYLLFARSSFEDFFRIAFVICASDARPLGFAWVGVSYQRRLAGIGALEFADLSMWRPNFTPFITVLGEWLRSKSSPERPIDSVRFALPANHPAQPLLGRDFKASDRPYAWYVRVPDVVALLKKISGALSQRLNGTVHEGLTQEFLISSYRSGIKFRFENGAITDVIATPWPRREDAAASFPDLTFYQMLFGRMSFAELHEAHVDCFARSEIDADLLDTLFPKRPSDPAFAIT